MLNCRVVHITNNSVSFWFVAVCKWTTTCV